MLYGSTRRKRERKGEKYIFEEIMAENLPNLRKHMNLHIQKISANSKQHKCRDQHYDTLKSNERQRQTEMLKAASDWSCIRDSQ